jgi:hypothetical protein
MYQSVGNFIPYSKEGKGKIQWYNVKITSLELMYENFILQG